MLLQGLLLSKNQAARRVEVDKTMSNRFVGVDPSVKVTVPNGWTVMRQDFVTKLKRGGSELKIITAVLKSSLSCCLIGAYVARNQKASQVTLEEIYALSVAVFCEQTKILYTPSAEYHGTDLQHFQLVLHKSFTTEVPC